MLVSQQLYASANQQCELLTTVYRTRHIVGRLIKIIALWPTLNRKLLFSYLLATTPNRFNKNAVKIVIEPRIHLSLLRCGPCVRPNERHGNMFC